MDSKNLKLAEKYIDDTGLPGGFAVYPANEITGHYYPPVNPDQLTFVVMDEAVNHEALILKLRAVYPPEHEVTVISETGEMTEIRLPEAPRGALLALPPIPRPSGVILGFSGFMDTMAKLLSPDGCVWDKKQTHETLVKYLQEEAYEFIDAVNDGDNRKIAEELGDLLLQIVFHAEIARRDGEFTILDVIASIDEKLKRRHPHVWGEVDVHGNPDEVVTNWNEIKAAERKANGDKERKSILDRVPKSLPALDQAHQYDSLAASVGFDWETLEGAIDKMQEEIGEVLDAKTHEEKFGEVGDVLFVASVISRWMEVNPEAALRRANERFYERFTYIERQAKAKGQTLKGLSLDEMEALWQEAKSKGIGL